MSSMQTLQKVLPKYTIALGVIFIATVIFLMMRGNVVRVDTVAVKEMELVQAVYATGYVDADIMADLRTEISGTVGKVGFREGERVKKGDKILEFDDRQLQLLVQEAEAALSEQQAAVNDAILKLQRSRNLYRMGAVSRQQLDDAENIFVQADRLLQQRRLQHESSLDALTKLFVEAPIDGVLALQDARAGDFLSSATLVATVIDTSSYVLNVEIDELDVPKLKVGQLATIALDALSDDRFHARVERIVPQTDKVTKTSRVYLALQEPVGGIQVGMTATANIIYSTIEGALLVPKTAVFEEERLQYVWKIDDGLLKKQPITPGASDLIYFEVTNGLAGGDLVVLNPEERFRDGMEAEVADTQEGSLPGDAGS